MLKDLLQGRFMNHPLHPLLVHLPIGLWVGSVIFDITFMANHNPTLAGASFFCILVGIIGSLLALPAGLADYLSISSNSVPKRLATSHMLLSVVIIGVYSINLISRYKMLDGVPVAVSGGQLFLSMLSVLLLGVSGYLGGLLVFEYGIGFRPSEASNNTSENPRTNPDHHDDVPKRKAA
jgi:uncharacterized membrane protein